MKHTPSPSPSPCHCFNLRRAGNKLTEIYNGKLAQCGITISQFALLSYIKENEPINTSKLAEMMSLDRTTLVRNLKTLEKSGFITFSQGSGRERPITLTIAGKETQARGKIYWQQAQSELEKTLGTEGMTIFREMISTINNM